jgi:hypothetical protein
MTAEDLIELLEERPFRPLRLGLANGRSYNVRHSKMADRHSRHRRHWIVEQWDTVGRASHALLFHVGEAEPVETTQ